MDEGTIHEEEITIGNTYAHRCIANNEVKAITEFLKKEKCRT
jgi:hypothetical protein